MGNFAENLNLGNRVRPPRADVANSKRHQRLDKIFVIFTYAIQEISKVVCQKIMMSEMHSIITSSQMLYETRALQQVYAAQTGLC